MSTEQPFRYNRVTVPQVRGVRLTHYGVSTHYIEAGEGLPVIFLHGGTGSGESAWGETVPGVGTAFHAIGLDQIGYGYTDKPQIDSLQMQVDHVAGFIDAMGFEKVGLVGQSTGGYIASKYACDYPERVFGLGVINSATVARAMDVVLAELSEGMKTMKAANTFTSREGVLNALDVLNHNKSKITEEMVEYKLKVQALPGWLEARRARDAYRARLDTDSDQWQLFNLVHRLPHLTVPATLIWGIQDRFALVELARRLKPLLPNFQYHEVDGGSHYVFRDRAEVVNQLLIDFFTSATASEQDVPVATNA